MTLKDIINIIEQANPTYKRIHFYYHENLYGNNGEVYPAEFTGVSSYHDNYFDTSEDPDGWSLDDKVKMYTIYDPTAEELENNIVSVNILLEDTL